MNIKNYFNKFSILFGLLCFSAMLIASQTYKAPREEKLLNGLKLYMWNEPAAEKVTVKLRINSGSSFDQLGKEGTMAMLSEILFPSEAAKDFFVEDLNGSLEIISNYEYIQINATGDNDKLLTILETLSRAVINPEINKETTALVQKTLLEKVEELEKDPSYLADLIAANRLLGNFPYGRPQLGTRETLTKIDFADLILAQQKFLTADNAALAVTGNIKYDYTYKASRRLFGGWGKSDGKVPATFAQPEIPSQNLFIVESPVAGESEIRFATRGFAKNDKDFYASQILARILEIRLKAKTPAENNKEIFVRHKEHLLPGFILFGFTYIQNGTKSENSGDRPKSETNDLITDLLSGKISESEFQNAKNSLHKLLQTTDLADLWLDLETYKLGSMKEEVQKTNSVTLSDVQRVAEKLQKQPVIMVVLYPKAKEGQAQTDN